LNNTITYKTFIVIPCYNEQERFKTDYFTKFLERETGKALLFVNDGSRDSTSAVIEQLTAQFDNASHLVLHENSGKGEAVRNGVLHAVAGYSFEYIAFADADLSAKLEELNHFENNLSANPLTDAILGSRVQMLGKYIQRNIWRHYLSRLIATFICKVLDEAVYDTQCGLKIFRKETAAAIFKDPFISKWFFDVELLARYKKMQGTEKFRERIIEIPLSSWVEKKGSKLRLYNLPWLLIDLLKIKKKYRLKNAPAPTRSDSTS
jgi:glycosyltransferase involved in cell wall biosynthesis